MRTYEYRHIVAFEETSLAGNVYYTNHVRWQGRCREMFLREHAPEVVKSFEHGFTLATLSVSCEYLGELYAFDEMIIRMSLGALKQNRITMLFQYWRITSTGEELVARGSQEIACMQRQAGEMVATQIPLQLREALARYAGV